MNTACENILKLTYHKQFIKKIRLRAYSVLINNINNYNYNFNPQEKISTLHFVIFFLNAKSNSRFFLIQLILVFCYASIFYDNIIVIDLWENL